MGNILFASAARSDQAAITAGSVQSGFPATNLQTPQPGTHWRSAGLGDLYLELNFGASPPALDFVCLGAHNGQAAATWRVRAAASQGDLTASPGYDSGAGSLFPTTRPDLDDWPLLWSYRHLAAPETYRWWRIDVADAGNTDGFFKAGRIILDRAFQPARNISYGWGVELIDDSPRAAALGGQLWPSPRNAIRRALNGSLRFLDEDEAYGAVHELVRRRGASRDVIVVRDPEATAHWHRQMVYGLLDGPVQLPNWEFRLHEWQFRVEEMLP